MSRTFKSTFKLWLVIVFSHLAFAWMVQISITSTGSIHQLVAILISAAAFIWLLELHHQCIEQATRYWRSEYSVQQQQAKVWQQRYEEAAGDSSDYMGSRCAGYPGARQ